jgi:hypothetical protein
MTELRELSNKWAAISLNEPGERTHVIPLNDLQDHILSKRCWCQPYEDEDCEGAWVHSSADGRELYEAGLLKAS